MSFLSPRNSVRQTAREPNHGAACRPYNCSDGHSRGMARWKTTYLCCLAYLKRPSRRPHEARNLHPHTPRGPPKRWGRTICILPAATTRRGKSNFLHECICAGRRSATRTQLGRTRHPPREIDSRCDAVSMPISCSCHYPRSFIEEIRSCRRALGPSLALHLRGSCSPSPFPFRIGRLAGGGVVMERAGLGHAWRGRPDVQCTMLFRKQRPAPLQG